MSHRENRVYSDQEAVANAFASFMKEVVNSSDHSVSIALSGGSTPKVLFGLLANNYKDDMDWVKIQFFWGDERCVPTSHEESNYRMTREYLLDHIFVPQRNIHRIHGEENPDNEALRYGRHIQTTVANRDGYPQFDLIILGMGDDGHTASIFPDQMELLSSDDVCRVATHPESGQKRITLTGKVINNAKNVAFLVTGENKKDMVKMILGNHPEASGYPASHIRPVGNLFWYLDESAAGDFRP